MMREFAKEWVLRHAPPHRPVPIMWGVKSHPTTEVCMHSQPGMGIIENSPSCSCAVIQALGTLWCSHGSWEIETMVFVIDNSSALQQGCGVIS